MFRKSQALRTSLKPFWGVHLRGQTRDSVWNPLGEALTTEGGRCQAAEVRDKGWKEGGAVDGSGSPSWCGCPGKEVGYPSWNTTAYVLLLWDLGRSTSTFCL